MTGRGALPPGWPLFAISLAAWVMLASAGWSPLLPAWCGPADHAWASVPDRMDILLRLTSPTHALLSWALMLAAMMVPLLRRPLARGGDSRAVFGFVAAYLGLWLPAIAVIALTSTAFALATQANPIGGALVAVGVAVAWQGSAARARCLGRCHNASASGGFANGAAYAADCIGACWAMMLLPNLAGPAHLPAMMALTALLVHERGDAQRRYRKDHVLAVGMILAGIGLACILEAVVLPSP